MFPFPWFVGALRGWILREREDVIAFLREENRVLRAQLRGRRPQLSDEERRRLARLGHQLGRAVLVQVATIATADAILRWHREVTARTCTHTRARAGRPRVPTPIRNLILRMASENDTWGYTRIQGAMKNLGHSVGRSTIARILKAHGVPPSRQRPMAWGTFVRAHWPALFAADVFVGEVCRLRRCLPFYTALIAQLHLLISSPSSAIGAKRSAEAHAALAEQIDEERGVAHSDLRRGLEEGWWQEPAPRHGGRARAPDVSRRAERRHRGTGRCASMKDMSRIRAAA